MPRSRKINLQFFAEGDEPSWLSGLLSELKEIKEKVNPPEPLKGNPEPPKEQKQDKPDSQTVPVPDPPKAPEPEPEVIPKTSRAKKAWDFLF